LFAFCWQAGGEDLKRIIARLNDEPLTGKRTFAVALTVGLQDQEPALEAVHLWVEQRCSVSILDLVRSEHERETADRFGVSIAADHLFERFAVGSLNGAASPAAQSFLEMVNSWTALSTLANELARGMGHVDFYPFVLSLAMVRKLFFIHRICAGEAASSPR
jgi:Putative zinc-binding metallo-peptidase